MSVKHGRQFLSIPGPTTVPDEVLSAMHRPAIDIYSGDIIDFTESCLEDLRAVFKTAGRTYIYAANGHGAWEAALMNTLSRGDTILVLESGRFAKGWGEMATFAGITVDTVPGKWRSAVDPTAVEEHLKKDSEHKIKAILVVQIDTASGVLNDIPAIRGAIDAAGHPAMLFVDTIASLGCVPFEMDAWGVDVSICGGQKGLMTPPGLSFVAAGKRAIEAHQTADMRTQYWDWTAREGEILYQKYCGTPPEHLLFGFRKALDLLLHEEGLENAFARHRLLAQATRRAVAVWSEAGALSMNVLEPAQRADSVTTILLSEGYNPAPLLEYCREKAGVTLGIGIGETTDTMFRIAHMGHTNAPMVLGTLGVTEMGLAATGIPHGRGGVQAAVDFLGEAVTA